MTSLNSLPASLSPVSPASNLIQLINGQPFVSSKDVARRFQRKHKEVLRDIERVRSYLPEDERERNFAPTFESVAMPNNASRQDKYYLLSEQSAYTLCAGFTGKAAALWRWELFQAFRFFRDAYFAKQLEAADQEAKARLVITERQVKQAALAEGAGRCLSLSTLARERLKKILAYRLRGFSQREICAVTGLHRRTVQNLEKTAQTLGLGANHAALR
jgi:phage regulator Rha-like protein